MSIQGLTIYPVIKLSKLLLTLENGSRPSGGVGQVRKGIPSLGGEHISNDGKFNLTSIKYVPKDFFNRMSRGIIKQQDVLIVKDGATTGKTAFVYEDFPFEKAAVNEHVFILRPDVELLVPEFLFFFLYSAWGQAQIEREFHGGAIGGINQSFANHLEITLPPLPEQRRIVAILHQADMLSQWGQETTRKHDQLLISLFYDLFGNPLDDANKWGFKPIRKMGTVSTGNTPLRERKEYYGDFIEWIKTDNISDDQVIVSKSQENLSELGMSVGRKVSPGSVLIACIAGSLDSIGRVALTNREVAFNQQINAITPLNDINPYYLYAVIKLSRTRIQANSKNALKEIVSKSTLEEILILCPPKNLQDEFSKRFLELNKIKDLSLRSKESLSKLFLSLSNRAFTGELTASWREKHKEELQRAAVERDKELGLRGEVPTLRDFEEGRITPEELEPIRKALGQFAVNLTKLTEPILQGPLFEMSQNIFEPLIQALRQSQQAAVSVQPPLIPEVNSESFLSYIDNLPVPQEKRAIIETLDTTTLRVLKLAGTYPAYFTANDLEAGELGGITTLQAETSLRTLQALGFVNHVQIDGLLRYRLTVDEDYGDMPYTLQP